MVVDAGVGGRGGVAAAMIVAVVIVLVVDHRIINIHFEFLINDSYTFFFLRCPPLLSVSSSYSSPPTPSLSLTSLMHHQYLFLLSWLHYSFPFPHFLPSSPPSHLSSPDTLCLLLSLHFHLPFITTSSTPPLHNYLLLLHFPLPLTSTSRIHLLFLLLVMFPFSQ